MTRWVEFGLIAWFVSSCAAASPPPTSPSPLLGKALPALGRSTLDGASLDNSQLKQRLVVVKFFAQYCEPCKKTLPHAQRLHEQYQDVVFIGVSLDERRSDAVATVQHYGLTFPILHDPANVLAGRFRVTEMPVTFVVNRHGDVQWVAGPDQAEQDLERALDALR